MAKWLNPQDIARWIRLPNGKIIPIMKKAAGGIKSAGAGIIRKVGSKAGNLAARGVVAVGRPALGALKVAAKIPLWAKGMATYGVIDSLAQKAAREIPAYRSGVPDYLSAAQRNIDALNPDIYRGIRGYGELMFEESDDDIDIKEILKSKFEDILDDEEINGLISKIKKAANKYEDNRGIFFDPGLAIRDFDYGDGTLLSEFIDEDSREFEERFYGNDVEWITFEGRRIPIQKKYIDARRKYLDKKIKNVIKEEKQREIKIRFKNDVDQMNLKNPDAKKDALVIGGLLVSAVLLSRYNKKIGLPQIKEALTPEFLNKKKEMVKAFIGGVKEKIKNINVKKPLFDNNESLLQKLQVGKKVQRTITKEGKAYIVKPVGAYPVDQETILGKIAKSIIPGKKKTGMQIRNVGQNKKLLQGWARLAPEKPSAADVKQYINVTKVKTPKSKKAAAVEGAKVAEVKAPKPPVEKTVESPKVEEIVKKKRGRPAKEKVLPEKKMSKEEIKDTLKQKNEEIKEKAAPSMPPENKAVGEYAVKRGKGRPKKEVGLPKEEPKAPPVEVKKTVLPSAGMSQSKASQARFENVHKRAIEERDRLIMEAKNTKTHADFMKKSKKAGSSEQASQLYKNHEELKEKAQKAIDLTKRMEAASAEKKYKPDIYIKELDELKQVKSQSELVSPKPQPPAEKTVGEVKVKRGRPSKEESAKNRAIEEEKQKLADKRTAEGYKMLQKEGARKARIEARQKAIAANKEKNEAFAKKKEVENKPSEKAEINVESNLSNQLDKNKDNYMLKHTDEQKKAISDMRSKLADKLRAHGKPASDEYEPDRIYDRLGWKIRNADSMDELNELSKMIDDTYAKGKPSGKVKEAIMAKKKTEEIIGKKVTFMTPEGKTVEGILDKKIGKKNMIKVPKEGGGYSLWGVNDDKIID